MNADELRLSALANLGIDVSRLTPTIKTVATADPAANAELTATVPGSASAPKYWKLLAVTVQLVQGATQTPLPNLVLTDGTSEFFSAPGASAAVSAATTTQMTWAPNLTLTAGAALTRNYAPIPVGLVLPFGYKVTTVTTGIGANTNYGIAQIWVVEYA
jgi:hypothetical protein